MSATPDPEEAVPEVAVSAEQQTQQASSEPPLESESTSVSPEVKVAELEAQLSAAKDAQLRVVADMDNLRKRLEREIVSAGKYSVEKLLGELLGVADSLELGLAAADKPEAAVSSLVEGMQLTQKQLSATLEKHGVTPVDPTGQPFNPDLHQAMTMQPSNEVPPNHVLQVMQKGYRLHDRTLRPAMVVVAKAPEAAS